MSYERCAVPPPGWSCSRRAGHEGPCAASPEGEQWLDDVITGYLAELDELGIRPSPFHVAMSIRNRVRFALGIQ